MRDGKTVATAANGGHPEAPLVRHMLGKELAAFEAIAKDADEGAQDRCGYRSGMRAPAPRAGM